MDKRFECILKQESPMSNMGDYLWILKDTKTGVLYVANYHGVLTVMVDKDGKPLTN